MSHWSRSRSHRSFNGRTNDRSNNFTFSGYLDAETISSGTVSSANRAISALDWQVEFRISNKFRGCCNVGDLFFDLLALYRSIYTTSDTLQKTVGIICTTNFKDLVGWIGEINITGIFT